VPWLSPLRHARGSARKRQWPRLRCLTFDTHLLHRRSVFFDIGRCLTHHFFRRCGFFTDMRQLLLIGASGRFCSREVFCNVACTASLEWCDEGLCSSMLRPQSQRPACQQFQSRRHVVYRLLGIDTSTGNFEPRLSRCWSASSAQRVAAH
jgi:hypothetical protein